MRLRLGGIALPCSLLALLTGCSGPSLPDPKLAAESWAAAAERGDVAALHRLLPSKARATTSEAELAHAVAESRAELRDQAAELRAARGHIITVAVVRCADGTEASLTYEKGRFVVASAGLIPGGGATPEEALASLRESLRRRSYGALLRLLSPSLRATVEAQLRGLVDGLGDPRSLALPPITSDELEVKLANGHRVRLKRIDHTWYLENFE